ncbi:MAG: hypothetical protein ACI9R3_003549 [Verrucomicrobiales bacterium]|jgi:hypothetical protein
MKPIRFSVPVFVAFGCAISSAWAQDPVTLPADVAGSVDAAQDRGFRVLSVQSPLNENPEVRLANTLQRAIQQFNGTLKDAEGILVPNEAIAGTNADGSFSVDAINFEQTANPEITDLTLHPDDVEFPGIPGTGGHTEDFVTEVITYIELAAGTHSIGAEVFIDRIDVAGGNNDDILIAFTGTNPRDYFATQVGEFLRDGELTFVKQPQGSVFEFTAPSAGLYPFRFLYLNRSDGATLALYDGGNEELLNSSASGVTAFQNSTDPKHGHAYIAEVRPVPGSAGVQSNLPLEIWLADDRTTVAADAVTITFNGSDVTSQADVAKSGSRVLIEYQPPTSRQSSRNDIVLTYTDSAGTEFSREWSFTSIQGKPEPKVAGQWDFSGGLESTVGPDLTYRDGPDGLTADGTKFGTTESFDILGINDEIADVMFVPADADWEVGYRLEHGIAPNGGGSKVNQYTLIMDVYKVAGGGASAIIQTRMNDRSDASFFWQSNNMGQGGGGYEGLGTFTEDEWHRIAFAVDLAADPPRITKWVDGESQQEPYWRQASLDQARRALDSVVYFFNDGDERSEWFVNSIQLWDGFLSNETMMELGGPTAEGFEAPNTVGLQFTKFVIEENGDISVSWRSRPNRSYTVEAGALESLIELTDGYASQGDVTTFTDPAENFVGDTERYFRVTEE